METLLQDLRYGMRILLGKPGFTLVAVVTLALGVGASTAIFSVVNAVLLRPLPFKDPGRLVMLWEHKEGPGQQSVSYNDFVDIRDQNQSFEQTAAISPRWSLNLTGGTEPEQIFAFYASASLFPMLGVSPASGRAFLPEEDGPGAERVVILSHGLWQRQFGAIPDIVGKPISLNGVSFTVVGVMPAGFHFLEGVDLWLPLALNPILNRGRTVRFLSVVAQLKQGVTITQAQAESDSIARALEQQYPESNTGFGVRLVRLHEQVTGNVETALLVLLAAVCFVLLIACANVANLTLARASARQKEVAVRAALGAGRARLLRQFLTESVLLAGLGGVAGLLLAMWGVDLLLAFSPGDLPRQNEIGIDGYVLGFALAASVITGIVFGLVPALQSSRPDLNEALKESGRSYGQGRGQTRLRGALVSIEIAMALVLLIASGLLIRSFLRLVEVNPGFTTDNVVSMVLLLSQSKYPQAQQRAAFYQQLEEKIKALPGVVSTGAVTRLPLMSGSNNITSTLTIEGQVVPAGELPEVDFRRASTDYFQTLGIPLIAGRLLTDQDAAATPGVALINEAAARRFWPGEEATGKRIKLGPGTEQEPWVTIVGVVGNVRHLDLATEPRPELYYHYLTSPLTSPIIVVRTTSDPRGMIAAIKSQVRSLDGELPISNIATLDELVTRSVAGRRFSMLLLVIFAAIALVLAAVGIYGVMSYTVTQRTPEIGVRMALGAKPTDVLSLVIRQGMTLTLVGVAAGLACSLALTRLMSSLLYGVSATDPITYIAIPVMLAGVALAANFIPARRATKVDPMIALRHE